MKEITRKIPRAVELDLWTRAAGRCQFSGCNKPLYKSPITQRPLNIAQKAHIYSFSKDGPRGRGPYARKPDGLNRASNLMLVCHGCHKEIDEKVDGGIFPASLVQRWKEEHERRVWIVTGVNPNKKSHVVLYGANIGEEKSPLQPELAMCALFPSRYPAEENPIGLAMTWEGKDDKPDYWHTEGSNLEAAFERYVRPRIAEGCHFSVFGLAPMPLLIRLGTLFTEKTPVQVYQLRREPEQSWRWSATTATDRPFVVREPKRSSGTPAFVVSLSARISRERVTSVLGEDVAIWELTLGEPGLDFLKSLRQLSRFRETSRHLLGRIAEKHGLKTPLAIFPAMPVACAVELGRIRMPKASMPWEIYDQSGKRQAFVHALTIGG